MFTQPFIFTNTQTDPALVELRTWVETDTTDTTQYGFANSSQVYNSYRQFITSCEGFVDQTYGELGDHSITSFRVWETEADRDTANANLRSNVALYNAYSELLTNYRSQFNITADPVPGVAPYYYP